MLIQNYEPYQRTSMFADISWAQIARLSVLVGVVILASCDQKAPSSEITELGTMTVSGICKEDHADKSGDYSGFVMLFRVKATGKLRVLGSVVAPIVEKDELEYAEHPNEYRPPTEITIDDVGPGATSGHLTLHGISDSRTEEGEADKG